MPASWRTSDLALLAVVAAATILLTVVSFVLSPQQNLPRENGSSYSVHADGAKAAFSLLKDLGYRVERSFDPIASVRAVPAQTILVIASPSGQPSDQDRRALLRFLEQGGTVMLTGASASSFLAEAPRTTTRLTPERRQTAALPSPLTAGVPSIEMSSASGALPLNDRYVPVYGSYDAPAVLTARFARGRVIWWAASTPLLNSGLGRPGHAELLVNAVGVPADRQILWDEFYHGYNRSFWSYISGTPLPIAGLQLLAIAVAAAFTYSRRHRPIRAQVLEPRTSPLEFVDTIGGLYARARSAHAAVATVYGRVRGRLIAAAGLPQTSTDERLVSVAATRLQLDATTLSTLLARAKQAATDPSLSETEALRIAAQLQQLSR